LQGAEQLIALPFDPVEIVVGQLPPLFANRALHRAPVTGDCLPTHCGVSCIERLRTMPHRLAPPRGGGCATSWVARQSGEIPLR
jgi:hypothetical protein